MSTVRDLIKDSMMLLGALASGETPSAPESADALRALNRMLDSWSLERLNVYAKTSEELTLVPSLAAHTMGSGGTFDTVRPTSIVSASLQIGTSDYSLKMITHAQYIEISSKEAAGTPTSLYVEMTNPRATLYFWPVPNEARVVSIDSVKPLSTFASINDTVAFPPGYERAIVYNLALEMAPMYGKALSAEAIAIATESKSSVKRANIEPEVLFCDVGVRSRSGSFNIVTGQ